MPGLFRAILKVSLASALVGYLGYLTVCFIPNPSQFRYEQSSIQNTGRRLQSRNETISSPPLHSSDIALCLITKDDLDLEEWVTYHLAIGIGRIYIFDNNSTRISVIPMLHTFITRGQVVYRYLSDPLPLPILHGEPPRIKNEQAYAYRKCLREFRNQHHFIGFIDSDEYIVIKNKMDTLLSILENYRNFGGLTLNWMVFGTSGHVQRPSGGVLANYFKCHPHRLVKTIVNTMFVKDIGGTPHNFVYKHGYYAVDSNFSKVPLYANPPEVPQIPAYLFEKIYLNNYELKSQEDYLLKMKRGRADLPDVANPLSRIEAIDSACTDTCELLQMPSPRRVLETDNSE